MSGYHLKLSELVLGYGGAPLIKELSIEIKKGEIVSLIGPNGSGKSTILKAIASQLTPLSGAIFLSEQDIRTLPGNELAGKRAVVLTERIKTELLTCYDIVASGRYPYTGRFGRLNREDEEAVDSAMRLLNAEHLGPRLFSTLSDGQKQRVLFARAVAQEPELLILDEPTSYLDLRYQLELLTILKRLSAERGMTLIMSLHEMELARRISDRVICVREDHRVAFGRPEEIFKADFIRELLSIDETVIDESLRDYVKKLTQ